MGYSYDERGGQSFLDYFFFFFHFLVNQSYVAHNITLFMGTCCLRMLVHAYNVWVHNVRRAFFLWGKLIKGTFLPKNYRKALFTVLLCCYSTQILNEHVCNSCSFYDIPNESKVQTHKHPIPCHLIVA